MSKNFLINLLACIANWVISYQVFEYYQFDKKDLMFWWAAFWFEGWTIFVIWTFPTEKRIISNSLMFILALQAFFHAACGTVVLGYDSFPSYVQSLVHDFILFDRDAILVTCCMLQLGVFIVSGSSDRRDPDDSEYIRWFSNHE